MPHGVIRFERDKALTLFDTLFEGTWAQSAIEDISPYYNSNVRMPDF